MFHIKRISHDHYHITLNHIEILQIHRYILYNYIV